jgi:hypothetical protein
MHKARILELLKVAEGIDPKRLDMCNWACGTCMCLLGFAAVHPPFVRQGLKLVSKIAYREAYPYFEESCGLDAAMDFFDLTIKQAEFLFLVHGYTRNDSNTVVFGNEITKELLIRHINHLLNGGTPYDYTPVQNENG